MWEDLVGLNMQIEYLDAINYETDSLIRLFDFNLVEARQFQQLIRTVIIAKRKELNTSDIDFIHAVNCKLIFRIDEEDIGITTTNNKLFYCDLTLTAYQQMADLLEPFCIKEKKYHYQWLYDLDNPIDLLFSPSGTW